MAASGRAAGSRWARRVRTRARAGEGPARRRRVPLEPVGRLVTCARTPACYRMFRRDRREREGGTGAHLRATSSGSRRALSRSGTSPPALAAFLSRTSACCGWLLPRGGQLAELAAPLTRLCPAFSGLSSWRPSLQTAGGSLRLHDAATPLAHARLFSLFDLYFKNNKI